MIDTNEIREAAARLHRGESRGDGDYNTLIAFIGHVERLMRRYRWIPVEERLPKTDRLVLLYAGREGVFRGHYDHVHQCWRTTKSVKITHWRLPDEPGDWE